MGQIADAFRTAFRDYETDGVPSSGAHRPQKANVRRAGEIVDRAVSDLAQQIDGIGAGLNWINANWTSGTDYEVNDALFSNGGSYRVTEAHTSSSATRPGIGNDWQSVWSAIVEPVSIVMPDADVDLFNARRLYDDRAWPLFPRAGYQATPRHNPTGADVNRASPAWAIGENGLVRQFDADVIAHDYDPVTGRYLGWLVEPPSENTFAFPFSFGDAYWTKLRATALENAAIGLDGQVSATQVRETTENGAYGVSRTDPATAGDVVSFSFILRPVGGRDAWIFFSGAATGGTSRSARFVLSGEGSLVAASADITNARIKRLALGLYQISATLTVPATGNLQCYVPSVQDGSQSFAGNPSAGYDLWHAQRESRANPTSIMRDSNGRPVTGITRPVGDAREGTIITRFRLNEQPLGNAGYVAGIFADSSNRAHIGVTTGGAVYLAYVAGGNSYSLTGPTIEPGEEVRAAASYIDGAQYLAVNGTLYTNPSPISGDLVGDAIFAIGSRAGTGQNAIAATVMEAFCFAKASSSSETRALTVQSTGGGGDVPSGGFTLQRVEVASDLSRDMTVVWHGPSDSLPVVQFRELGEATWETMGANIRSVPFSDDDMFFATLTNRSPGTIYEWRPAGGGATDIRRFRTLPDHGNIRVAAVSDFQRVASFATSSSSFFNIINDNVAAGDPDMVLLAGDYVNDDGVQSAENTQNWLAFINAWSTRWVDSDGCQIPFCGVAGNHETNPNFGGSNGVYGYINILFTSFFRSSAPNVGGRGYGYFTVGDELLCIGFDTHHGSDLLDQVDWVADLLTDMASDYRHVLFFGHIGPNSHTISSWNNNGHTPLRNRLMPAIQGLPNGRFYIAGHNHNIGASRKVLFVDDPAGGANAWSEDPDGIRVVGMGGWGCRDYLPYDTQDEASDPVLGDGSVLTEYLVASNQAPRNVMPISAPTNSAEDPATKHHLIIDLEEDQQVVRYIALNGSAVLTISEETG